jgi:hypothetical protein
MPVARAAIEAQRNGLECSATRRRRRLRELSDRESNCPLSRASGLVDALLTTPARQRRSNSTRPLAPVPRTALTRREAAASLGISINHFERRVQPDLRVISSGQLVLIPLAELERWVQHNARHLL